MSRLVVVLMLCLLPLRAWAGDSMAIEMAPGLLPAAATTAMPVDCPGHMTMTDDAPVHETTTCCDTCELCLQFTEPPVADAGLHAGDPFALPCLGSIGFVSTVPAPGEKPPRL